MAGHLRYVLVMARDVSGGSGNYLRGAGGVETAPIDISGTQLSMFCWFKCDVIDGSDQILFGKSQYVASDVQYNCGHQNGVFWFEIGDSGGTDFVSSPAGGVRVGIWHAGVGVLDGTRMQACLDGKIGVITATRAIQNTNFGLGIGVRSGSGGGEHDGRIAHVAIWAAGLKPDEMYRLTVLGESPLNIRPQQLRGYWPLEQYPGERDFAVSGSLEQIGVCPPAPGPDIPFTPTSTRTVIETSNFVQFGIQWPLMVESG